MSATHPIKSIVIIGDGLRASLAAACLAARCGPSGTRITVVPSSEDFEDQGEVLLRPNIRHVHQLLKIPETHILQAAQGRPLYAVDVECETGTVVLPFGPYGQAYKGVSFLHQIMSVSHRESGEGLRKTLSKYNVNIALHNMGTSLPFIEKLDFGYRFSRLNYGVMLQNFAQNLGASFTQAPFKAAQTEGANHRVHTIVTEDRAFQVDCVIDVRSLESDAARGWRGNSLYIDSASTLPGLEIYNLQSAIELMSDFMPDKRFNSHELSEFNRVMRIKEGLIEDMDILLNQGLGAIQTRPALRRKVNVFSKLGRTPTEDYEVFSPPEWEAALLSSGLVPQEYSRLADAFPADELSAHIKSVEANTQAVLRYAKTQGRSIDDQ
jgi:hypothetical protein